MFGIDYVYVCSLGPELLLGYLYFFACEGSGAIAFFEGFMPQLVQFLQAEGVENSFDVVGIGTTHEPFSEMHSDNPDLHVQVAQFHSRCKRVAAREREACARTVALARSSTSAGVASLRAAPCAVALPAVSQCKLIGTVLWTKALTWDRLAFDSTNLTNVVNPLHAFHQLGLPVGSSSMLSCLARPSSVSCFSLKGTPTITVPTAHCALHLFRRRRAVHARLTSARRS